MVWEFIHSFNKYLLGANVAVNKTDMVPAPRELIHITFTGSTRKGEIHFSLVFNDLQEHVKI